MKTLVTHIGPDLDAIASSWLIKKYIPGWNEAEMAFVPAGSTLDNLSPDENSDIIHTDTGLGKFDHHQLSERLSATRRVFDFLKEQNHIEKKDIEAIERMVDYVTAIDNFEEVHFPEPTADLYDFQLHQIIEGLNAKLQDSHKVIEAVFPLLEAVLLVIKNKLQAEKELIKGIIFTSNLGKSLVLESRNEEVMKLALKTGFTLVVRKDPTRGNIRIKTYPDRKYDLSRLYEAIKQEDHTGTWFLHSSKNMLLNGSSKNPNSVPSPLSLQKVIEIIKGL